ncbi:MAG TPA: hypothetical protein PL033_10320 [Candidatus Brocadiia bacterium]|nr:hypothetical protein [Candidatus Brocadiia bacterium]
MIEDASLSPSGTARRWLKGDFSPDELRTHLVLLSVIFWGLIFACRLFYPPQNRFSIMTHTFSFMGSFDPRHNPPAWFLLTIAMIFQGTAFIPIMLYLHRRFAAASPWAVWPGTLLFIGGCAGMFLVGVFPEAHGRIIGKIEWTHVHQKVAAMAFIGFGLGIPWYGLLVLKDWFRWMPFGGRRFLDGKRLALPYALYLSVFSTTLYFLLKWEFVYADMKAAAKAAGRTIGSHWSEALNTRYSFPLWENIMIYTLFAFMVWLASAVPAHIGKRADA